MTKILAVDDSASMRQMVNFTLTGAGYQVKDAEDGKQGLDCAKAEQFDVIVSDINMPVMDGITMISEIRKLPQYKSVPILMLTTESSNDKKMAGKQAGATGWIVKPFNPDQLLKTIARVV